MSPRDYALIAQEAYSAAPDIGIADSASRAILRNTPQGFCVAFPGTNNLPSWFADLNAMPMTVSGVGRVHSGFWNAWLAIADPVLKAIGDKPVTFVGHSLGAAIAIMAAATMTAANNSPVAVYGFEPPRVSPDINFRTLLANVPVNLYKNGNDLVPDVPLGWNHAAILNRIGIPLSIFPNVQDHAIDRVIAAFPVQ